jgi:hypothetical protein
MRSWTASIAVAGLVAAAGALGGCKSLKSGAREQFAKDFSCPEARVDVVARGDVAASSVSFRGKPVPEAERSRYDAHHAILEARGCDRDVLYTCSHPTRPDGTEGYSDASCEQAAIQSARAKAGGD